MAEFKLVMCRKDGKCFQQVVKEDQAKFFLKKSLKDKVSGNSFGMDGYEFEITGGSDKCGFPMRKGILQKRQKIIIQGKGVGSSGKNRNKKKQKGLKKKKTVCGERIDSSIVQINLKILKEGAQKLGEEAAPAEAPKEAGEEAPKTEEAPKEEKQENSAEPKAEEKPAEEAPKEEALEEK